MFTEWRNNLNEITPIDRRIRGDFMLIDDYKIPLATREPFILDVYILILCTEGSVSINVDMVNYTVRAPFFMGIIAGQVIQIVDSPNENQKIKAIVLSNEFASELLKRINSRLVYGILNDFYTEPVRQLTESELHVFENFLSLIETLLANTDNPFRYEGLMLLCQTACYGFYAKKDDSTQNKNSTRKEQVFNQFVNLLKQNYQSERSVGFYADKICLTPKYLSKIVYDVSGETASMWIDEYVKAECKALLKSTDMSIQQISDKMNFSSLAVFGKFFKRCTGLSPTEYRNQSL